MFFFLICFWIFPFFLIVDLHFLLICLLIAYWFAFCFIVHLFSEVHFCLTSVTVFSVFFFFSFLTCFLIFVAFVLHNILVLKPSYVLSKIICIMQLLALSLNRYMNNIKYFNYTDFVAVMYTLKQSLNSKNAIDVNVTEWKRKHCKAALIWRGSTELSYSSNTITMLSWEVTKKKRQT